MGREAAHSYSLTTFVVSLHFWIYNTAITNISKYAECINKERCFLKCKYLNSIGLVHINGSILNLSQNPKDKLEGL